MRPVSRRLRIAVLNRSFSPVAGGAERYSIALVEKLAAKHEIHVFAQSIDHCWPGVTYHHISMPLRRPRWINQLWFATLTWWATRRGFDVVHSHENTWHGQVQTVHVLPIKHNLFHGLEGWARLARLLNVLTSPRLVVYLLLERARYAIHEDRAVVLISETLRTIFSLSYPGAIGMTSVIFPGIDLPAHPVGAVDRSSARRELGLPPDKTCLLFVGNDLRKKGLDALLLAMQRMPTDVVLVVVGDSAQRPHFVQLAAQLGLASRVFFLGALKDVSPAYRASDILVHPTLEDTFAMVVLEAMAHGRPVLVSGAKYCGIAGLLSSGINALLIEEPRDSALLAVLLLRLLSDKLLRDSMGEAARTFATEFSWDDIAARQEYIYQAVAAKSSDGRSIAKVRQAP